VAASRLLTLLVVVVVGGLAFAADLPVAPAPREGTPEFVSKDWKFAVKFPGKPEEKTQPGPAGIKMTAFVIDGKDGAMVIGVADMPIPAGEKDEVIQDRLDGSRDGAIRNVGGELTSSSQITIGKKKYPGREFSATLTKPAVGQMRCRVYLVGKRLYQVLVIGTNDYVTSKEATAFLDSFRLIE
jgi:hypothetical protein